MYKRQQRALHVAQIRAQENARLERGLLPSPLLADRPAEEILSTLSELLGHERQDDTMFATLCMISVHPDRTAGWVRMAGHLPPLVISGGAVAELPTRPAAPLGLSEVPDWPGIPIRLDGSWSILLYTDGLIEGRIGKGSERLGSDGLIDLITDALGGPDKSGEELLDQVIDRVRELNGGDLDDDLAVLALGFSSPDAL